MQSIPEALKPFTAFNQFIIYKIVPHRSKPGKSDKLPIDHRTGLLFVKDAGWQNDAAAWTTAENAIAVATLLGASYGVGFLFTTNDPFWFIDIDSCLMPDRSWSPVAMDLISRTRGCAIEVSQSGTGLHIFGTGFVPQHSCKNITLGLEFYTESRFVALTGTSAMGNAGIPVDMTETVDHYFKPSVALRSNDWTDEPLTGYTPFLNDEKLIAKACKSKSVANMFAAKASFADLWKNNVDALANTYPPDVSSTNLYDASSADMALASGLAFWTGCNCKHIENLMWLSALVREKWTGHKKYLRDTIVNAVSLQSNIYTAGERPRVPVQPSKVMTQNISTNPVIVSGFQFLAITQQIEHFKGCVYVQDLHKIFIPSGVLLKPDQFNATFGGYVFQLDDNTSGKVTKKAWEAFTESQVARYPKASSTCFRPDLPSGTLINKEGAVLVNTYVPIKTARQQGDVSRFLNHVAKMIPDRRDQAILLAYMAAVIQHKGIKFQWSPLIQGVEGNGKSLLSRCVAFAIGDKYTHMPPAEQIAEKYNAWLFDKIFIGVEDIYIPDHKNEIIEILKPMITNSRHAKRDMGVGQIMHDICCNFIFNSNHKEAVRKTHDNRRFAIFYCSQQSFDDIERDGMGGSYFPDLYKWMRDCGYEIVAEYLTTYDIPDELNPAGACHRAPMTTSTNEAIESSLGGIEQEIKEAIDEGRQGFAGGWVSSVALKNLLYDLHATRRIPPNKRRAVLQSLGYDWHPALNQGRTNSFVAVDQGKPRLFIKKDHIHSNLITSSEVIKAYSDAQTNAVAAVTASRFNNT